MDSIQKYYRVDALPRPLQPFVCDGQNLIRYPAYGCVRVLQAEYIPEMRLNIPCDHPLGIHGQNLFLDVLTDALLVLFQKLRLELSLAIPGDRYVHLAEARAQRL